MFWDRNDLRGCLFGSFAGWKCVKFARKAASDHDSHVYKFNCLDHEEKILR